MMEDKKINPKENLQSFRQEFGVVQRMPCSAEDNKKYSKMVKDGGSLPDGLYEYDSIPGEYYTLYTPDLSKDELWELLTYQKLSYLRTIKYCATFFVVLTIISLIFYIVLLLN